MSDLDSGHLRTPPHSVEGEQSAIGCLLLDPQSYDRMADLLTEADFYRHEHRLIWRACVELVNAGKPCDMIAVFERLHGVGKAESCGGLQYLNDLATSVPSAANARHYATIVREKAVLRKLIAASDEIAAAAFNPAGRSVTALLGEAEAKVLAVGESGARSVNSQHDADKLMLAMLDRVNDLAEHGAKEMTGLRTGFSDIDRNLDGLQRGDLIVLAARPSMGKTALALNIAENAAISGDAAVMIFSMEMGASQLALRMASSVGRVPGYALKTGRMQDDQWARIAEAVDKIGKARIRIDEAAALTVGDLRARARRVAREMGGLGLVVVDYLQLMSGGDSKENRATELGDMTRGLKAMAKELGCPVIVLSQLNRSVEMRNDKRPVMSDLRESGAIEQDADVILFIYRDDYYTKEASREPGVAEIIIAKHRNGATGTAKLAWLRGMTRFDNLAES